MVPDEGYLFWRQVLPGFQSALRFAVVPDGGVGIGAQAAEVSIRFEVRGGSRPVVKFIGSYDDESFQSALRFAVVPDITATLWVVAVAFQSALRFAVVPDSGQSISPLWLRFQSALRFAVVPDPTPWHAVLTSPVAAVLHTTPPHPLQQADRTCPKWGKTPSQVPYTPEAVFGRSPTPLSEGVSKMPGRGELGVFVGVYLGPGPVPRRGIRPRARSGLLFGRR